MKPTALLGKWGAREGLQVTAALLLMISIGADAGAQSAATVPASSGIYARLEGLTAHYPTSRIPLGIRPQSRRALLRVVDDLRAAVENDAAGNPRRAAWARREIDLLDQALRSDTSGVSLDGALRLEFDAADVRPDTIKSNNQGGIDAVSVPLLDLRNGRTRLRGGVASVVPTVVAGYGNSVALVYEPRASVLAPAAAQATAQVVSHRFYARGVYRNFVAKAGMDEALWGQSELGALFVSGNTESIPAIEIATDTAITLPWLFRHAGPVTFRGQVGLLGRAQQPRNAKVASWHATMQPVPRFELGVTVVAQQGGEGGPRATFVERVVDLLPLIDALAPARKDLMFSNKLAGGNLRIRMPEWSGLDLYYEMMIDDFDLRRFESTIVDDFSHLLGLRLPLLLRRGELVLRAEMHNTGLRTFEHSQYLSGYTFRQRLIGSPLGPNAKGWYGQLAWKPEADLALRLNLASEMRDPSLYEAFATPPFDEDFRIVRLTNDPRHRRHRVQVELERLLPIGALDIGAGLDRVWRDGGRRRTDWVVRMGFSTQRLAAF